MTTPNSNGRVRPVNTGIAIGPSFASIQDAGLTPTQVVEAYNMPSSDGAGVKVGIVSLGGGWLASDLQKSMLALNLPTPVITTVLLDGATGAFDGNINNPLNASIENTLDLYCIASTVPSANIILYTGQNSMASFERVIQRAVDDDCDVISISWAIDEVDLGNVDVLSTALTNANKKNITVLAATGDYGSDGATQGGPVSSAYPASSPLVTAVGGTILTINTQITETFSNTSGGGISTTFKVPAWQDKLTYKTAPTGIQFRLNRGFLDQHNGRGTPDISAPMNDYGLYFNGAIAQIGGTSASTAIMAGMIARFIALSGKRLGAANEFLYKNSDLFTDITFGNDLSSLNTGYFAEPTWDPVTGLGSPEALALYNAWQQTVIHNTPPSPTSTLKYGLGTTQIQNNGEWDYLKGMWIKDSNSWTPVKTGWVCKNDGTWERIYPTPKGVFTANVNADGLTHTYYQYWPDSGNVMMIQNTGDYDLTISNMTINDDSHFTTFDPSLRMPLILTPNEVAKIPLKVTGNTATGSFYGNIEFTCDVGYLGFANVTVPTTVNVLPDYNGIALLGNPPLMNAYVGDDVTSFSYSGYTNTGFTVPVGVNTLEVSVAGAGGGGGGNDSHAGAPGGTGHTISGTLTVTPGDVIGVYVGQGGRPGYSGSGNAGGVGGANGAGYNGGNGSNAGPGGWSGSGGGGGGATVITVNGAPVIVAGGGGGGGGGGNWSYGYGQVSGQNGSNHYGANGAYKGGDGGGGGGGGGGYPGGIAGPLNGGDSGGYSGSNGFDLVPNGFTVGVANNGGGVSAGGGDGYATLKESGLAVSAQKQIIIKNSGNGADLTVFSATSVNGYFAVNGFVPNTVVGFDFNTYEGNTMSFSIIPYASLALGTYTDTLLITSDAVNHPQFSIPVIINVRVPNGNRVYQDPGSYRFTVPQHVHSINVTAFAAGGAGGVGFNYSGGGGGGGGSGGYQSLDNVKVVPGEVITVNVGAGGEGEDNSRSKRVFPVSLPYAWNSFMNAYAVWPSSDGVSPVGPSTGFSRLWVAPYTGSYTLHLSADNYGAVDIDGTQIGAYTDFGSTATFSFTAYQGNRLVSIHAINYGGPAGVAATITDTGNNIVWTTRDLLDPGASQAGGASSVSGSFGTIYVSGGAAGGSAYESPSYTNYGGYDGVGGDGTGDGAGDGGGGGGDGGGD